MAQDGQSNDQQSKMLKSKIAVLQQQVDQQRQTMELQKEEHAQKSQELNQEIINLKNELEE